MMFVIYIQITTEYRRIQMHCSAMLMSVLIRAVCLLSEKKAPHIHTFSFYLYLSLSLSILPSDSLYLSFVSLLPFLSLAPLSTLDIYLSLSIYLSIYLSISPSSYSVGMYKPGWAGGRAGYKYRWVGAVGYQFELRSRDGTY